MHVIDREKRGWRHDNLIIREADFIPGVDPAFREISDLRCGRSIFEYTWWDNEVVAIGMAGYTAAFVTPFDSDTVKELCRAFYVEFAGRVIGGWA